jgi:hypothetical protein
VGSVGIADVSIVPRPGMAERIAKTSGGYRVVGDLREGADIIGDRSAVERAERREHDVVVRTIGVRASQRRLGVGVADDGHHRNRRDIVLVGLVRCRSGQRLHVTSIFSYSARASRPAWDENGVVRNSPPPVVYPSSLNLRPYGVSAGKSVWQVPQGCPVCRAKLGKACADGARPIVSHVARKMISANATANLRFRKLRSERSRCMAIPCNALRTRNSDVRRTGNKAKD